MKRVGGRGGKEVYLHREIMEDHLGRKLRPSEHVHHINEDKTDNRIENLVVVSNSEHQRLHRLGKSTNPDRRDEIENLLGLGWTQTKIADHMGITQSTVSRYKDRIEGKTRSKAVVI